MKKSLLIVERMVFESLHPDKEMTTVEISNQTGLCLEITIKLLQSMSLSNFIKFKNGKWTIEKSTLEQIKKKYNTNSSYQLEIKEIFSSLVNEAFANDINNSSLKMKKLWMTEREKSELKSLLFNLDISLSEIAKKQEVRSKSKEFLLQNKSVVTYGISNYGKLAHRSLNLVI